MIVFSNNAVKIFSSYNIKRYSEMKKIIKDIKENKDCPECVKDRWTHCLIREWQGHNLLYDLHLFRSHTEDVDLDARQWFDFAYHICGFIYHLFHW